MINEYLVFVTLAITITAIPGPAVILTVKNSIKYGFKVSLAGILGNCVAMIIMASISALGLGAIILASSTLFAIVKIIGGVYLVYLGVKAWNTPLLKKDEQPRPPYQSKKEFMSVFKEGFWVGISNPKAIAFFTAVFPHFIDPTRSFAPQFLTLILTVEGIACFICTGYALLSSRTAQYLHRDNSGNLFPKLTGGAFIGFGVALLYEK